MVATFSTVDQKRYSAFLTPEAVVRQFILPDLLDRRDDYCWVDLFAGRGDLLWPLLETVPKARRSEFFDAQMRLFDIQPAMVEWCQQRAIALGVATDVARRRIRTLDTLLNYPTDMFDSGRPVYHVTNPPFLYLGLAKKRSDWDRLRLYFGGDNKGFQDLYQVALANDLRHGVSQMIYVLPTNFLFAEVGSQKIRQDLLSFYWLQKAVLFEHEVFEHTGVHTGIFWFTRKQQPNHQIQTVLTLKPTENETVETITLSYWNGYRPGETFQSFVQRFRHPDPLRVSFHLPLSELRDGGPVPICALDVSHYENGTYRLLELSVSEETAAFVKTHSLFVRTLDGLSADQNAGFYSVRETYGVDTLVVTKQPFRTHPALLRIEPALDTDRLHLLKDYCNLLLNYFRKQTASSFMTTFKYSKRKVRKYFGLKQARALVQTFPYDVSDRQIVDLRRIVDRGDIDALFDRLMRYNTRELRLFEEENNAT